MKYFVELQIQLCLKRHYKCRLAGVFNWRLAVAYVEQLTLSGICNAAQITAQFAIVQKKPDKRIIMHGVELQIQSR